MTLPLTAADVLNDHTRFEIECIDRMYLNVYVAKLQYVQGVIKFLRDQLGMPIPSTAPLSRITRAFNREVERFAAIGGIPVVDFKKGERKDDMAHEYLKAFPGTQGVLFIGRAQEKTQLFRTETRHHADGQPYPFIVQTTGVVKHWYFYCVDEDFGPFFIKFCSYFPYTAKLCINGHHWAQRQATRAGLNFVELDNGFADVDDPDELQAICDELGPQHIRALIDKWLALLPHPFTPDQQAAGYTYDASIRQAEFSLTQVLDRPLYGRIFFDQIIRDNLHLGRPDQVGLIFNRIIRGGRRLFTPSQFRTRVITENVTPSLHIDYKTSKIKQYHKLGVALRTETTINDPEDFNIRKGLINLPAMREVGFSANRSLLRLEFISHNPADGAAALAAVCQPVTTPTGQRVPGLPLANPRTQALLATLCVLRLLPNGFTNQDLRKHVAPLLERRPDQITAGQASYDLRRLLKHDLIRRIPKTHRYRVTTTGMDHALFLTRVHRNVLNSGMAQITQPDTRLHAAAREFDKAFDHLLAQAHLKR